MTVVLAPLAAALVIGLAFAPGAEAWSGTGGTSVVYYGKDNLGTITLEPEYAFGSWSSIDISGTGTTWSVPDGFGVPPWSGAVGIGFTYDHFGASFTQVRVNADGLMTFGTASGTPNNQPAYPMNSANTPNNVLAAFWVRSMNAGCSVGPVKYQSLAESVPGSSNGRSAFAIQYTNVGVTNGGSCGATYGMNTFQIRIYEDPPALEVHYNSVSSLDPYGGDDATGGIRGGSAADVLQSFYTTGLKTMSTAVVQYREAGVVPDPEDDPVTAARTQDILAGGTTLTVSAADGVLPNDVPVGAAPIEAEYVPGSADSGLTVVDVDPGGSFEVKFDDLDPCKGGPASDGVYSFDYRLYDAWILSDPGVFTKPVATVSVKAVNCNQDPTVSDASVTATEDTALSIPVTASDPDSDALTYTLTSAPSYGSLAGLPGSATTTPPTLSYTPQAQKYNDGTRLDTFEIQVDDGKGGTDTATFTVDTKPVNDAPVLALATEVKGLEDTAKTFAKSSFVTTAKQAADATALSFDESGQALTLTVTTPCDTAFFTTCPAIDPVTWDLEYEPKPDVNGIRTVTLRLADDGTHMYGGPGTPPAADPKSVDASLKIVVEAVNDAPELDLVDPPSTLEDQAASHAIGSWVASAAPGPSTATDEAAGQASTLAYTILTACDTSFFATCPQVHPTTKTLTYAPKAHLSGSRTITVELKDDGSLNAAGSAPKSTTDDVTIEVDPVNDAPSFTPGAAIVVAEDAPLTTAAWATGISKGPADEASQTLTFVLSGVDAAFFDVTPTIDPTTGEVTFRPKADVAGTTTATVVLVDSGGTADGGVDTSSPKTLTLQVDPLNDPPVAVDDAYSVFENRTDSPLTVLTNDHDVDGDALSIIAVSAPLHGNVTVTGSTLLYSPDFDYGGPDTFTYTITDGAATDTATVTIEVADPVAPLLEIRKDPAGTSCIGDLIAFEGEAHYKGHSPVRFAWDFGDGTTDDVASTDFLDQRDHVYAAKAVVVAALTVEFDDGTLVTKTVDHRVLRCQPPVAHFNAFVSGLQVTFVDGSHDPDGTIETYAWTLGDGSTAATAGLVHAYGTYGQMYVVLTVTDDEGFTDTYADTVVLQAPKQPAAGPTGGGAPTVPADTPIAPPATTAPPPFVTPEGGELDIVAEARAPATAAAGDEVLLDGSASTGPAPLTYRWIQVAGTPVALTDAASATARFTVPPVAADERLVFELVVTDGERTASDRVTVQATPAPRPAPAVAAEGDDVPHRMTFRETSLSYGPDATLTWEFGDGSPPAQGTTVAHTFPGPGTYTVRVVVDDPVRGRGEHVASVEVRPEGGTPSVPRLPEGTGQDVDLLDASASLPNGVVPAMLALGFLVALALGAVLMAAMRRR